MAAVIVGVVKLCHEDFPLHQSNLRACGTVRMMFDSPRTVWYFPNQLFLCSNHLAFWLASNVCLIWKARMFFKANQSSHTQLMQTRQLFWSPGDGSDSRRHLKVFVHLGQETRKNNQQGLIDTFWEKLQSHANGGHLSQPESLKRWPSSAPGKLLVGPSTPSKILAIHYFALVARWIVSMGVFVLCHKQHNKLEQCWLLKSILSDFTLKLGRRCSFLHTVFLKNMKLSRAVKVGRVTLSSSSVGSRQKSSSFVWRSWSGWWARVGCLLTRL